MLRKFFTSFAVFFMIIALSACTEQLDNRGKPVDNEDLSKIKPAAHTKSDVQRLLGSPTLIDKFSPDSWFYLYRVTTTTAFFKPHEKALKIVAVNFDKSGIVKEIKTFGEKGTRDINIVSRETPTKGKDVGYLEQIFGNFGRIHKGNTPLE